MRALTELKKECFKRIGSNISCFCCGKDKYSSLLIHHLSYTEKSITYNKFENSDDGRLKYYANLLELIWPAPVRSATWKWKMIGMNSYKPKSKNQEHITPDKIYGMIFELSGVSKEKLKTSNDDINLDNGWCMFRLVFCLDCGECLGEDVVNVAKKHLKKFPNHISYLTKNLIDPFLVDDIDDYIEQKLRTTEFLHAKDQPQNGQNQT